MKTHEIMSLIEQLKIFPNKIRNQLLTNQAKRYPEITNYYNIQEYEHQWVDKLFVRHELFKLYKSLLNCPLDMQAQILSAMKPDEVICFSMTNRYWYDFCRSDRMQVYWQRQITFTINSKTLNYFCLYRSYMVTRTQIHDLLNKADQVRSRKEKISIASEIFQLIITYPELVTYHDKYRTTVKKKLVELYHQQDWHMADEFHQKLFGTFCKTFDQKAEF